MMTMMLLQRRTCEKLNDEFKATRVVDSTCCHIVPSYLLLLAMPSLYFDVGLLTALFLGV